VSSGAPDPEAMVELLRERYRIDARVSLAIEVRPGSAPHLSIRVERTPRGERSRVRIVLDVRREGGKVAARASEEAWAETVDAADALVGQLIESDFAYRALPTGEELEFGAAKFTVQVDASRPELEAVADDLLSGPKH
jgi:hypothetical protein